MLRPFAHPVVCCCMSLRVVGSCWAKFESGQTFEPISFLPWSPIRRATMFDRFALLFQPCWGHARALHGLQSLVGCILPTMQCGSQHCWKLLHSFSILIQDMPLQQGWYQRGSWWISETKYQRHENITKHEMTYSWKMYYTAKLQNNSPQHLLGLWQRFTLLCTPLPTRTQKLPAQWG